MVRNKNAIFLGDPGRGLELTRAATRNSDLSSSSGSGGGLKENLWWVLAAGTKSGTGLSPEPSMTVVVVVVAGELIVIITAKGKQRSRAHKRDSGVGDSMVDPFPPLEWKESDFQTLSSHRERERERKKILESERE